MNTIPLNWCDYCEDTGWIDLYHPSTDGLIGVVRCDQCLRLPSVYKWWSDIAWKMTETEYADLLAHTPPF